MPVVLRAEAADGGPSLLLRSWTDSDADALVEAYRDPVLRAWTRLGVPDAEAAAHWVEVQRAGWESGTRLSFAVLEEEPGGGGRLAGNVVLKRPEPAGPAGEVGYWTAAHARGRGVAPRALQVLTDWVFESFAAGGVEYLELMHQVDNTASCRVAEKAGYGFERILPAVPPFPRDGHLHLRWAAGGPVRG
ncbi:GNAT family N-acetyltransferase [Kitasatospora sp. NBC_00240]|uniref:GNAT family N-acetyltransferase n=1 Tax=Kitasatospora sp. NBC_00240 TaxID=2903567 RepID=UPI0022587DC4|nr:GNAT family N-acetyltransferase [Kitasatospora sp. NBC_00240]MCX5213812.1 GNAT family N-acetyltransferase [Kitasatospora sp. NBC_00240]